jgi:hypothetical protein
MGVPCCRPRKGGFWGKDGQRYKREKNYKIVRFPPFRILGTPKQKIFFSFSKKKFGRATSKKM